MLRDFPKIIMMMFIGFFLMLLIAIYSINNYKQDSSVNAVNETLKATALQNRDDSARVNRGQFRLNRADFEKDFKERLSLNRSLVVKSTTKYYFDYLDDNKGGIKAIKVKIANDGLDSYQGTTILNVAD